MKKQSILFYLICCSLGTNKEVLDLSAVSAPEWKNLVDLSFDQGVASIAVDGLQKLYESNSYIELYIDKEEYESLRYEWYSSCFKAEHNYKEHLVVIERLAILFNKHMLRILLLKGYGLSLNYPIPEYRTAGDVDIYLYGLGETGDSMIMKNYGCEVKQNEDKHSVFTMDGITVENHARFVPDTVFPSLERLNEYLVREAELSVEHHLGNASVFLPSVMFNAIFIPFHCACHFVRGEASLRQICDWVCFVMKHGFEVNWNVVEEKSKDAGFWIFLCCLNGIIKEQFGVSALFLPAWPRYEELEARILEDILTPKKSVITLWDKVYRFFSSRWKFKMVYKDNMLITAFRCGFRSRGTIFRIRGTVLPPVTTRLISESWYRYQESEMSVVGFVPSVPLHDGVSELTFTICEDASPTFCACAVTVRQAPGGAMS